MKNRTLDTSLTVAIVICSIIVGICMIALGRSYIEYYSEASQQQLQEIQTLHEEIPELEPVIVDVTEDNVITKQEYDYVITVGNEIKRKRLFQR